MEIFEKWVKDTFKKKFDISAVDPFAHGYGYMWYLAEATLENKKININNVTDYFSVKKNR